jgi:hypothetical protein
MRRKIVNSMLLSALALAWPATATAQIVESVGSRALGMGGAFVAVADDSTANWWNPGALATGPFVDGAVGLARTESRGPLPVSRDAPAWLTVTTPALGFGYYRLRITDIEPAGPTGEAPGNRESGRTGKAVRALEASQYGVTVGQTLWSGVHVGSTLKVMRGTVRHAVGSDALGTPDLLDLARSLTGGDVQTRFDLDVGVMAVAGPLRLGGLVRNLRQVTFGSEAAADGAPMRLSRQVRVGVALDASMFGEMPLIVSLDVDAATYATSLGDRRVAAVGIERWLFARRLGLRGGARVNQVGHRERSGTAGASVALKPGMLVEGHLVAGGSADERGWGVGARVTF